MQPQQVQVTIEQLVPFFQSKGAVPDFAIDVSDEAKSIRLVAICGPIAIPVDVPYAKARETIAALADVLDKFDPQPEEAAEETGQSNSGPLILPFATVLS